jgi:hypothetical protein
LENSTSYEAHHYAVSRHFSSLRSEYSQHRVLKHSQSVFLPLTSLTELIVHAGLGICLVARVTWAVKHVLYSQGQQFLQNVRTGSLL